MRGDTRRKIEMAARVREFSRANPSTEQPHEDVVSRLEERLARADTLGVQQRTGTGDAQAASARRMQTRLQIEFALLGPLVKVGRSAAKTAPELLGKFKLSQLKSTHKAFLIAARTMLAEATTAQELLLSKGLAAKLLEDLGKALDRFEAESNAINLARRGHIGARVELTEVAANLTDLVNVLDAFNRYRYQEDPEQLAVWNAARSVVAHTARRTPEPPSGPTPTGGASQAA
jgi:hypothetical protein